MIGTTEIERILVRIVADATSYDRVMDRVVGKMTTTAARLTSAGRRLTYGITAPLLAMAAVSVASAGKFEYSAARIQGAANLSVNQITAMKGSVRELGRELGMRPTALINTFEELTKGGMELDKILGGSGKVAGMLARVGDVDNATAAKTIVKILSIFRSENMSAAKAADTLSAAADASVISIQDMIHSTSQGASMASLAGQSFEDFATAIALLGQGGIVSRDAGTSLKTFFMALASTEREKYFKQFGVDVTTVSGKVKPFRELLDELYGSLRKLSNFNQLRVVSQLFGADASRAAVILGVIGKGSSGFDAMKKKMEGALTVEQKYALLQNTFNGQMERMLGLIEDIGIEIGGRLVPYIKSLGDVIVRSIGWWRGLSDAQRDFLFSAALFAGAAGPMILMSARLIGLVQVLSGAFWGLSAGVVASVTKFRLFLLTLPRLLATGTVAATLFGRGFVLSMGAGIMGMSRYLAASMLALWRVVAISMAPVVSLFAPFVMDIVVLVGGIGLAIVRQFAFLPAAIMPIFTALWQSLVAFVGAIPAVLSGLRVALVSFMASIPAIFTAFQAAGAILIPWVMSLGQAMLALATTVFTPIIGMIYTTIASSVAAIAVGIGGVLATVGAVAAFPVIVIAGLIAIVEVIKYVIGSTEQMDMGFKLTSKSIMNFVKALAGGVANMGQNWDLFVTWFSQNWSNMLVDALKAIGWFFVNMGNNTLVGLAMLGGMLGIWTTEWVSYFGDAFAHGWDIVMAWIGDTLVAFKDWSVRVGTMIWDALTGGDAYQEVLAAQAQKATYMQSVNPFKSNTFGQDYEDRKMDMIGSLSDYIRTPLQGFESSMQPLPEFNTDSKFVDDMLANGFGFNMPELKAPDIKLPKASDEEWVQNLLRQMQQPQGTMQLPELAPKVPRGGQDQGPGDTFKETSLRRFMIEGPGGLSRPTDKQQKEKFVDNEGIKGKLEDIKQAILLSKGIIR